jgi:ADP-heptose:LPS heptosyltransferase
VSLQYTDCEDEIAVVEALGYQIKQFPEVKAHDYYETAKLVQSCDLVISVCTSVVHLAGALGVPCWVMTPFAPAWRYQHKGPMPWYRSVRLYRQPDERADSWIPVVQRIGLDLEDLLNERREKKIA